MIYLDYQATTPLAPEAFDAMLPWLRDLPANPHSPHRPGRAARAAVEAARERVASLLPRDGTVNFTGNATEALNWAIKGVPGDIVTFSTEHAAVLETAGYSGRPVTVVPVGADGLINLQMAREAIRPGTGLVAAMLVNNEIGVIQPVAEIAKLAEDVGAVMLCDAVQGYGRVPISEGCHLIALSAHKIHGPKGIGALWIAEGFSLIPLLRGGLQEPDGRSGTISPALCAGFGAAAALAHEREQADRLHVERLWAAARTALGDGWTINGSIEQRYHGNLNIRRDGLDVARLMSDLPELAFSAGSACASGSGRPSHVLGAIGLSEAEARSSIRLGFGRYTSEAEIEQAAAQINAAAERQQAWA